MFVEVKLKAHNSKATIIALKFFKMKKNLLFPLSVFIITIVGLLVFSEASSRSKQETSKVETVEQHEQVSNLVSMH